MEEEEHDPSELYYPDEFNNTLQQTILSTFAEKNSG